MHVQEGNHSFLLRLDPFFSEFQLCLARFCTKQTTGSLERGKSLPRYPLFDKNDAKLPPKEDFDWIPGDKE